MTAPHWRDLLAADLLVRQDRHLLRKRITLRPIDATHVEWEGKRFVNFSGNDYLGLTHHPRVIDAVRRGLSTHGFGSGASALISGYTDLHASAEETIARWKSTEAALLLSSGYQANFAAVQTIAGLGELHRGGVRFLVDKLAHASLIDAVRASQQPFRVFPHNHLQKLRRLLEDRAPEQLQVVVTESVFSMDGDAADLHGLAGLKRAHDFLLLLDEAHGSGVYGENGAGLAAELGLQNIVDVTVVTLSKALGCVGGAVCASRVFCDAVLNLGRALVYTTNLPAAVAAGVQASIGVLRDEPERQQRVRALARRVRTALQHPPGGERGRLADSPIIPVILGIEEAALKAASALRNSNLLVFAVRPPTVPRGTSRLRVTVSSEHTDDEIDQLLDELRRQVRDDRPAD